MIENFIPAHLSQRPKNLTQSPDNPLQVDRLPQLAGVELDYPVYQDPPPVVRRQLLVLAFVASLVAPILGWASHLVPIPLLAGGLNTLVLLTAAGMVVYGLMARRWPLASLALALAVMGAIAILVVDLPYAVAAGFVGVTALALFADRLADGYWRFKTAAPVDGASSRTVRALWDDRWRQWRRTLRGAEFYPAGYLACLFAGWGILEFVSRIKTLGDFPKTILFFGALALFGALWHEFLETVAVATTGRPRYTLRQSASALGRALLVWNSYNRRAAFGAGVHEHPSGTCLQRRILLVGLIAVWCCLWSGMQLFSIVDYVELARSVLRDQEAAWSAKSQTEETLPKLELEPHEREFLSRLTPAQQEQYARERVLLHVEQFEDRRAQRQIEASTQSAEELVVAFFERSGRALVWVLAPSASVSLALFGLLIGVVGRSLAGCEAGLSAAPPKRVYTGDNWETLVARIARSQDPIEKESILMGVNARDDTPVLVPLTVFAEHAHFLGDTGSGKTSRGIMPLVTQLMRRGDASVLVLDLKADDQSFFEALRVEAAALDERLKAADAESPGYPFRWFTTVLDRGSFAFNPLAQRAMPRLSPTQRTDVLIAGLGLNYGTDYGRKFYGDSNYDLLHYVITEYPDVQSFAELAEILAGAERFPLAAKILASATNVSSSIRRLARIKAFNAAPNTGTPQCVLDHAIDLGDLFVTPQAVYVALPPPSGITNTAEIARIILYSLMSSAPARGPGRKQVYLVIDEFQRLVSKNVELLLQAARSLGISCILANQALADLAAVGADLIPAVKTNCRYRQIFGAGNYDDILDILGTSGETIYASRSWSFGQWDWRWLLRGFSIKEYQAPRLSVNDILLATDCPGRSIAYVRRGDGYAQFGGMPFLMDSVHHISPSEYKRRREIAWPPADERMVVSTLADSLRPPLPPAVILGDMPRPRRKPANAEPPADGSPPDDLPASTFDPEDEAELAAFSELDEEYGRQVADFEAKRKRRRRGRPGTSGR